MGELTAEEFEELVEGTIGRRPEVWLTQLMDTFEGAGDENGGEVRVESAASLCQSLDQATAGAGVTLGAFRRDLGA